MLDELVKRGLLVRPRQTPADKAQQYALEFREVTSRKTDGFQATLRRLGVLGDKHIPAAYLRASEQQRRDLLAGLCDTDGHLPRNRCAELTTVIEPLADQIVELLLSLGEKPTLSKDTARLNGIDMGPRYRITWTPLANPMLARDADHWRPPAQRTRVAHRRIVDVRRVPSVPCGASPSTRRAPSTWPAGR